MQRRLSKLFMDSQIIIECFYLIEIWKIMFFKNLPDPQRRKKKKEKKKIMKKRKKEKDERNGIRKVGM